MVFHVSQIEERDNQIVAYQRREQELLNQLSIPLDKGIQHLLEQLETAHKDLLHHQLAQLKRTYLSVNNVTDTNPQMFLITPNPSSTSTDTINSNPVVTIDNITLANTNVNNSNVHVEVSKEMEAVDESAKTIIHIVKSETSTDQCETAEKDFELDLPSAYRESVSEDSLQIDSEDIPIENDSSVKTEKSPPTKRRRGK